ncbi:MAG: hypothetical protein CMM73_05210 [Rhodospirillaceae bacterium]|nr:hypothetical protein [Rhodospirillaceae bacterium]|tara:strand:- start:803 stop:1066 length:264 start_codon:yes stop_codon:yes gene_type:complete
MSGSRALSARDIQPFGVDIALSKPAARLGFIMSCGQLTLNGGVFVYATMLRKVDQAALEHFIYPLVPVMFSAALRCYVESWTGWAGL